MQKVQQFVERVKDCLDRDNVLFTSTIELAGSTSEGTKIYPQDEFDYQFKLTHISQCIKADRFIYGDQVQLCLVSQKSEIWKQVHILEKDYKTLNEALLRSFNTAVYNILQQHSF